MAETTGTETPAVRAARLALEKRGYDLTTWVTGRREADRSWRQIEAELHELTDGEGRLNRETLRAHFTESVPGQQARAS